MFAVLHSTAGFLGYFKMKNVAAEHDTQTQTNRLRFSGLHFKQIQINGAAEQDPKLYIPIEQLRTLLNPEGEYAIMTQCVDKMVVAYKGQYTLKMWF